MASAADIEGRECFALRNVDLEYGNLTVLKRANFSLRSREIHALVGEHGAGKSTIAKIIAGFEEPGAGELYDEGVRLRFYSPQTAKQRRIELVMQNNPLFGDFTVANNIMIDKAPKLLGHFSRKRTEKEVSDFLTCRGIDLNPLAVVKDLNLSDRVMVDFCKHIYNHPRILILDETLEQLSNKNLQRVIPIIRGLKEEGACILFITHRVDDIYEIADKVSIIRDGKILVTEDVAKIDKINLIKLAYTQVIKEHSIKHVDPDFYQLLKYNEAILTHLPFSLMVTDTKRNVRLINNEAKTLFSFEESAHLHASLRNFLGPQNAEVYRLLKDRIIRQKEDYIFNIQIRTTKGLSSHNISVLPLFDGTLFIGNIITMEDVTEYENLRRQLSLSENLSSIGLLAAGVAHEINNPLEIINYYMQNLRLTKPDDPGIAETVREVEEEIVAISSIIDNLLLFSDSKKLENEQVELNSLLGGIIQLLKKTSENRNITLHYLPTPEELVTLAAKTELKQVFLNVLKNSFEALRDTGSILVEVSKAEDESGKPMAAIRFADTGPGIDDHIISSLFQPFFSTKKDAAPNMGLGLSISYNIVIKYGGTMNMRNAADGGCETLIRLPLLGPAAYRPGC